MTAEHKTPLELVDLDIARYRAEVSRLVDALDQCERDEEGRIGAQLDAAIACCRALYAYAMALEPPVANYLADNVVLFGERVAVRATEPRRPL